jgi:CheY-like chemotaxis protein/HPt (histidine-containing phosphotransfer) domain-containing protein
MDYQLPLMDGLTATARLRQDLITATIPVIVLTALSLPPAALHMTPPLFDACISKPLRYHELYAVVNTLLDRRPWQPDEINRDTPAVAQVPAPTVLTAGAPCVAQAVARVVDVRVLEALVGPDPAVVRGFFAEFQSSAAAICVELQAACVARQALLAGQLAHKLKSAAYAVGAVALGQRCAEMEAAGKAEDMQELTDLWPLFALERQAVHQFLAVFLASG